MTRASKNVLITGGSKGLGLELVKILLERGNVVYNLSRTLPEITHKNLISYQIDLTDSLPEFQGDFDTVILNVGMNPGQKNFEELTEKEINDALTLNLTVHLKILNSLRDKLAIHKGKMKIVIVDSVLSMASLPGNSLYCASKAFMSSFGQALRREGHSVYIVYPYKINTGLFHEVVDFLPLDKGYVARTIVRDIETGRKERILPWIFNLVPVLNSLLPVCVQDWIVIVFSKLLIRKPSKSD